MSDGVTFLTDDEIHRLYTEAYARMDLNQVMKFYKREVITFGPTDSLSIAAEGPGEEDGPWAEGYEERAGLPQEPREFEEI